MIRITKSEKLPPVQYKPNPPFGTIFTPHVLKMELTLDGPADFHAQIIPLTDEPFPCTASVLHYGQSIFEGMKSYRQKDGDVAIFRADLHAQRFRNSAKRMVLREIPEDIFLQCLREYTAFVADNVPSEPNHSLYLRPLLMAADRKIKVGASQKDLFYIMSSIAGGYFGPAAHGGSSVGGTRARVMVCRDFVRAFPHGLGEVKTAANYAASIWPQRLAAQKECDQVLFLDAVEHEYIDELGGMNFCAIRGKDLVTPALNGCILDGVTRRSLLEIAPQLGLSPVETRMSFSELRADIKSGRVTEVFACGTAAIVSPIGEIYFQEKANREGETLRLPPESKVALDLRDKLGRVQRGHDPAPGDWLLKV